MDFTTPSLEQLRRDAKRLKRAVDRAEPPARQRFAALGLPRGARAPSHADALHVVAHEHGFASWPALRAAAELSGLDVAARRQRLKIALYHGQTEVIAALVAQTPDIAKGAFGLSCALYDREEVERLLQQDPGLATRLIGPRRPILHLAFSRYLSARPEREGDMIAIAERLLAGGADVNDGMPVEPGSDHRLSALYGAIGHAGNMVLGRWLLEHGADPNDGESLYHATELGHRDGLRMLLEAGADPAGTNALLRAMDFHDHDAVALLLAHGARADDYNPEKVGGEEPWVVPALHQAARRGSDRRMVEMLLDAGADPHARFKGATAYAYARVYGSRAVSDAIEARGAETPLVEEEALMAGAADGDDQEGRYIDPARLAPAYADLIREILHLPGRLDQIRRLVALGLPYDKPDAQGLTPVQIAGWEGLPDMMAYFLGLKPDLAHVNGYGGTLLSTIIHGSENNPERAERDYTGCLELALHEGVALPRQEIRFAGREDVVTFLTDWAEAHPGQVV